MYEEQPESKKVNHLTTPANNNVNESYIDDENVLNNGSLAKPSESDLKPSEPAADTPPAEPLEPAEPPSDKTNGVLYTKGAEVNQFINIEDDRCHLSSLC